MAFALGDYAQAYNPPYAAIVMDANTGKVLFARNADAARYPASLTKKMTLYMVFDALKAGRITLDTPMKASAKAAAQPPSKVGIKAGRTITVRDAIKVLITKSANDVAMVVAENLASSEAEFARQMTARARQIGLTNTTFRNPHGLPNSEQKTTARDMARLGLALIRDHGEYYHFFSTRSHRYAGTTYRNHNRLLGQVKGVDGIKTGFIRASGFNLTSSARRGGKHLIAVVMGGKSGRSRDAHMADLLNRHFPQASDGAPLTARLTTVPLPPVRPITVSYSQLPAAAKAPPARNEAPAPEMVQANVVTPPGRPEATPAAQTTIITPTAAPRVAPDGEVTDAIAKLINDQWLIQIGAFNDEPSAKQTLQKARQQMSDLSQMLGYTEPVQSNDITLWRARFSGFDRAAAQDACAKLKRASFKCLPLRQ